MTTPRAAQLAPVGSAHRAARACALCPAHSPRPHTHTLRAVHRPSTRSPCPLWRCTRTNTTIYSTGGLCSGSASRTRVPEPRGRCLCSAARNKILIVPPSSSSPGLRHEANIRIRDERREDGSTTIAITGAKQCDAQSVDEIMECVVDCPPLPFFSPVAFLHLRSPTLILFPPPTFLFPLRQKPVASG